MKNIILGFLIAVVCIFTIAATVPNSIMTVRPSKPTSTITKIGDHKEIEKSIKYWSKQGYIVTIVTNIGGRLEYEGGILVMEKY